MRRVLMFQQGSFSGINAAVAAGLRTALAPAEIVAVDIHGELRKRRHVVAANLAAAGGEYGWDVVRRRRDLDDAFFSTRFLFDYVKRLAREWHERWRPDCSIQTQSMFDCSGPVTPHFVYTDHTYRSCAGYPDYGRAIWAPTRRDGLIGREASLYRHADCVFTMSSNVERTLTHDYRLPRERVLCVGAGVRDDAAARLTGIPLVLDRYRAGRILFVGREWDRKGGPELLDAVRAMRREHPSATLVVVGCHPAIRDTGVEVIGEAGADELHRQFAAASVFCLPSRMEPFGLVFLEAMAAGLPVVARRLGATPDFVTSGTGVLLDAEASSTALADALRALVADPGRCLRLGQEGRATVNGRYSWNRACTAIAGRMRASVDRTCPAVAPTPQQQLDGPVSTSVGWQ